MEVRSPFDGLPRQRLVLLSVQYGVYFLALLTLVSTIAAYVTIRRDGFGFHAIVRT